jgi:4-amino-4-deoxy-L-arabinose transferase-like glycosyltransferase
MEKTTKLEKRYFWIIFFAGILLFFPLLGFRALWDPGEGRYAAISLEMIKSGNFLTPTLNYLRYFEKPPLAYWLNSFGMHIFGINEFGARFFTGLSGFLTVLTTYFFAKHTFNRKTAFLSAGILLSSAGFFAYSQILELDMMLTLFVSAGMFFLFLGFEKKKNPVLFTHLGYFSLGLGCLIKGPVAVVLPAVIFPAYLILTGQLRRIWKLYPISGCLLFLVVSAPWFIAVSLKEPGFAHFFFIHEHLERFTSTTHSRKGSVFYFIPVVAVGIFPWIVTLLHGAKNVWDKTINKEKESARPLIFLALSFIVFFGFFSVSGSKRPPYLLPVFPALAVIIGCYWDRIWDQKLSLKKSVVWPLIVLNLCLIAGLLIAPSHIRYLSPDSTFNVWPPAIIILGALIALLAFSKKKNVKGIYFSILIASFLFNIATYINAGDFDELLSRKAIAKIILANQKNDEKIISYNANYDRNLQSLTFYSGQKVYVIGDTGELELGKELAKNPSDFFLSEEEFAKLFDSNERVFVIVKYKHLDVLKNRVKTEIFKGPKVKGKLLVISNRPWSDTNE